MKRPSRNGLGAKNYTKAGGKTLVRKSKLEPYKIIIQRWLERHPYTATQIFQRLRAEEGSVYPDEGKGVSLRARELAFEGGTAMHKRWCKKSRRCQRWGCGRTKPN